MNIIDISKVDNNTLNYINQLQELINVKELEIRRLNSLIDKTIKYIKEFCIDDEFYINLNFKEKNIIELLTNLENERLYYENN